MGREKTTERNNPSGRLEAIESRLSLIESAFKVQLRAERDRLDQSEERQVANARRGKVAAAKRGA